MNTLIVIKKQQPRYSENSHTDSSNQRERAAIEQHYYEEYGADDIVLIHRILELHRSLVDFLWNKVKAKMVRSRPSP